MPPSRLIEYIPPEAVYHRVPLDDDKNTLGPWSEATDHLNYPDAESNDDDTFFELFYGNEETGERVDYPTGKEAERIATILENNRRAIELIDEGIERGRLQFPETWPEMCLADAGLDLMHIAHTAQVRHVKIRSLLAAGEIAAACEEAVHLLRMGEMICAGEGWVFQYIMGCGPRNVGANTIHRLVSEDEIPDDSLAYLLSAVRQSLRREDGLIQSLRGDLCCYALPRLEQMPEATDVVTLVDQLLELYYTDQILTNLIPVEYLTPVEHKVDPEVLSERLRWRREKILFLLDGHPDLFDKVATTRLMGQLFAVMIRQIERSIESNATDQAEESYDFLNAAIGQIGMWPGQLTPGFSCESLGKDEQACAMQREMIELLESEYSENLKEWREFYRPPTEAELARARKKLKEVRNPVGLLLVRNEIEGMTFNSELFSYRDILRQTEALLSKRLEG